VLAWRPRDARALALAAGLQSRPRRIALVAAAAALLLAAAGAIGWRTLHVAEVRRPPAIRTPPSTPAPAPPQPIETIAPPPSGKSDAKKSPPQHHARVAAAPAPSGATPAIAPPAVVPTPTAAPQPAPDAPATLAVAIAPWCDLTVDGQSRGRSPTTLTLPPGPHHLACVNPVSGNRLTRDLELRPGERRELREKLYAMVRVQPRLTRGDAFAVDGAAAASTARDVEPGRRRVTLYKSAAEIETRWIDVPPGGCTLVDAPRLSCEKP
jgi:hypothetical protein